MATFVKEQTGEKETLDQSYCCRAYCRFAYISRATLGN
jgi:hypothetical protein